MPLTKTVRKLRFANVARLRPDGRQKTGLIFVSYMAWAIEAFSRIADATIVLGKVSKRSMQFRSLEGMSVGNHGHGCSVCLGRLIARTLPHP
jgi:hypothetical protein